MYVYVTDKLKLYVHPTLLYTCNYVKKKIIYFHKEEKYWKKLSRKLDNYKWLFVWDENKYIFSVVCTRNKFCWCLQQTNT